MMPNSSLEEAACKLLAATNSLTTQLFERPMQVAVQLVPVAPRCQLMCVCTDEDLCRLERGNVHNYSVRSPRPVPTGARKFAHCLRVRVCCTGLCVECPAYEMGKRRVLLFALPASKREPGFILQRGRQARTRRDSRVSAVLRPAGVDTTIIVK